MLKNIETGEISKASANKEICEAPETSKPSETSEVSLTMEASETRKSS